jgi:uncharacterized protein (DUF4415 family)
MKKKKYDPADYSDAPIDDPDNPEWTEEMFRRAKPLSAYPELHKAILEAAEELRARKRGRPKLERPKVQVTLRLDADVVSGFKEDGPGWQGRINATLKKAVKRRAKRTA